MVVQWLGHHPLTAEGIGSTPGLRIKTPRDMLPYLNKLINFLKAWGFHAQIKTAKDYV